MVLPPRGPRPSAAASGRGFSLPNQEVVYGFILSKGFADPMRLLTATGPRLIGYFGILKSWTDLWIWATLLGTIQSVAL
jgi:hypothetical protein